jgi:hypothetical protein
VCNKFYKRSGCAKRALPGSHGFRPLESFLCCQLPKPIASLSNQPLQGHNTARQSTTSAPEGASNTSSNGKGFILTTFEYSHFEWRQWEKKERREGACRNQRGWRLYSLLVNHTLAHWCWIRTMGNLQIANPRFKLQLRYRYVSHFKTITLPRVLPEEGMIPRQPAL